MTRYFIILMTICFLCGCEIKTEDEKLIDKYTDYPFFLEIYENDRFYLEADYDFEENLFEFITNSGFSEKEREEMTEMYHEIIKVTVHVDKQYDLVYFIVHTYNGVYYIDGYDFDTDNLKDGELFISMSPPYLVRELELYGACYDDGHFYWDCDDRPREEVDSWS